jgi:hypothetical protein
MGFGHLISLYPTINYITSKLETKGYISVKNKLRIQNRSNMGLGMFYLKSTPRGLNIGKSLHNNI